ncbi:MAG: 50S ribosomal protein L7/L12 [Planctomycetes bacterium]|nr:50S ribosomal protein L7/L12 [Planctomycetota bacterium]
MSKFDSFLAEVDGCTVMELSELVQALEKKWGVSAAAAAAPAAAGGGAAAAVEEPTSFKVTLVEGGPNKIQAIKVIRTITGLGLADAKAFVEGAPKVVKEGLEKPAAEELKKQLEEIGAKVEVAGV